MLKNFIKEQESCINALNCYIDRKWDRKWKIKFNKTTGNKKWASINYFPQAI